MLINEAFYFLFGCPNVCNVSYKAKTAALGVQTAATILGGVSQIIQHLFINTNCILKAYKSYDVAHFAQETPYEFVCPVKDCISVIFVGRDYLGSRDY